MDLRTLFDQALTAHRQGQLSEAESLYLRILAADPGNTPVHYSLGMLRAQQGHLQEALDLIGSVLTAIPNSPELLWNHGNLLLNMGRYAEALASFDRGLRYEPGNPGLLLGRGDALQGLQRHEAALESYDRTLAIQPHDAIAHGNRGNALMSMGRLEEALAAFDAAVAIQPDNCLVHNNRGNVLKELGRLTEAVAALNRALELQPNFGSAYFNRGKALCKNHRLAEAFSDFMKSAELAAGTTAWPAEGVAPGAHMTRHDREQQDYLAAIGAKTGFGGLTIEGGGRLKGPTINPANIASAAQQWRTKRPQIAVIDNFLTDEALAELRRFCWGSTVWRTSYERGYLGAVPEYGFASPLLAQIADEFRTSCVDICGNHALKYLWAFKYDSALDGVGIHADDAAVNVNFWITPDEANLDPERGGLVVWDVAAPLDWEYSKYNGDLAATRAFLKRSNARPVTIPYRCNRAVIFDSDLFHETDVIRFKEGYLNRRINVTLLYGDRAPPHDRLTAQS
ncbi:MAG TPA: tetratricopeptide repeat protein [Rhizomicrobium sp.]|jgi:Flp pilus assembly protein TadD